MGDKVYEAVRSVVVKLVQDSPPARATLAKLRRGAGKPPGSAPEIWQYTVAPLEEETRSNAATRAEWAAHVALTLYGVHRQGNTLTGLKGGTLGAAVAALVDESNESAVARRFNAAATASTAEELSFHARSLVQLLKAKDVDMDYPAFAKELYRWQFDPEAVRLAWGRDFWRKQYTKDKKEADAK